jgi:DNA-binding SARP family transcriptional activator/tetratricopeptide (TPR) repeat protein
VKFRILGPLDVVDDGGHTVDVGGAQPRAVLAVLLAAGGGVVSTDAIVDAVWGETPPPSAGGTLQTYLSRLRRALEPERRPREAGHLLVSEPQGYRLAVDPDDVDASRFERLADDGRTALEAGRTGEAVDAWRQAEGLWRGPAMAEHRDAPFAQGLVVRLEERRIAVLEQRLEAELALGWAAEVAAEAAGAVRQHPLRERLWASLALACYRTGRQADALRALADARDVLVEELGIEPGRHLKELEAKILAHDPLLDQIERFERLPPAAESSGTNPLTPGAPPLVGRDGELATLRAAQHEARRASRFVVIEGEPGIGKTRLLDALASEAVAGGAVVVWGRTHESGAAPAFWPWLGALRSLIAVEPELGERLAPLLEPGDDMSPAEAGPATFRLYETVAEALSAAAATRPLVVLLDDLQWADPASLDLLGFLSSRLGDSPVLIGATLRLAETERSEGITAALSALARRPGTRRLVLRGLDEDESAALLTAAAGRTVAPPVAAAIHARAGGNPFFLGELTRLLDSEELLDDPAAVNAARVPIGVRDVVRRRLDRLPERTIDVLRVAAVIGRDLELPLLSVAAATPIDACIDALEPAMAEHLLVDSPAAPAPLQFAHALVREVLVEDMPSLRRARVHVQAADALVELAGDHDDDVAELVAEHLWAAVPLGMTERAAAALERAAAVAIRRAGFATGEDLLRRAVSLRRAAGSDVRHTEAELSALVRLASIARSLHGYGAILGLVDRGRELAQRLGARDLVVNLEWAEWAAYDTACEFDRADPLAERFLALAESAAPGDAVARMLGYSVWGIHCWHHGRLTEAADVLDASRRAAAELPVEEHLVDIVSEQRLLGETFAVHVHDLRGDTDDPAAGYAELIRSQDDRFAGAMIAAFEAVAATAVGDTSRAGRAGRAGLAADPDVAFSFWGSMHQMYLAASLLAEGADLDEAIALFERGHARYVAAGSRTGLGLAYSSMAIELAARGELDVANAYLELARRELESSRETWPEPVIRLAEAEVMSREMGDDAAVGGVLERAEAIAVEQGAGAIARRIAAARARLLPG